MPPSHIGLLGSWIEMHVPMLWTSHHLYSKTIIIFFPLGYTSKELSVVLFLLRNFFWFFSCLLKIHYFICPLVFSNKHHVLMNVAQL